MAEDTKRVNNPNGVQSKLGGNKSVVVQKANNERVKWKAKPGMEKASYRAILSSGLEVTISL